MALVMQPKKKKCKSIFITISLQLHTIAFVFKLLGQITIIAIHKLLECVCNLRVSSQNGLYIHFGQFEIFEI